MCSLPNFELFCCSMSGSNCYFLTFIQNYTPIKIEELKGKGKLEMKERGELKGARDQGRWIKVLTWELQVVRSYSSISCSCSNNNWISDEYHINIGQEKIHQVIWNQWNSLFQGTIYNFYILYFTYILYTALYVCVYIYMYIFIYIDRCLLLLLLLSRFSRVWHCATP